LVVPLPEKYEAVVSERGKGQGFLAPFIRLKKEKEKGEVQ
jgi:hypothetical protein